MLKIAICDDELNELTQISDILCNYKTEKKAQFKCDVFSTAINLLDAMKRQAYDVVLLDVLMRGMNGIATAHEIRLFDPEVKIIFLTSSPEFAVESYAVNAHYYLLKPCTADKLFPLLDKIILEKERKDETLNIMQPSGLIRIPLGNIEFLEVYGKRLMFHLYDGNIKEIRGSISEYEDKLLYKDNFKKIHRSFIVNMEYIQTLNSRDLITYSRNTLPISRLLYNEVKEAYIRFLFKEKGVE